MANAFTSALNQARDAFDQNIVKRGQSRDSRDSIETNDSPFGSSLVTPIDADDRINLPHSGPQINGVARFIGSMPDDLKGRSESSSSASLMDYFKFKGLDLNLFLQRSKSDTSAATSPVEEAQTRYSIARSMSTILDDDARPSPGCSTPGSVEEDSLVRGKSIYNLPNKPIVIKMQESVYSLPKEASRVKHGGGLLHSPSISEIQNSYLSRQGSECGDTSHPETVCDLDDIENPNPVWFLRSASVWSPTALATLFFKVILFVPWCISVGGTILLWPDQLELVAFQTGYVDSKRGIRRFAHWADVGVQLVMIFLAFVLCLLWFLPMTVGMLLVFSLGTRFVLAWQDFQVDYSVPLGEDDRQSFYLLAILGERGFMEGTHTVTKTESGFFVAPT